MSAFDDDAKEIPIKIGIVGDTETGKTSLMIKYVENKFDEDYIMTIGTILTFLSLRAKTFLKV
jgi:GTP-binding protein of the ras superfamily involved in termination of M-phase